MGSDERRREAARRKGEDRGASEPGNMGERPLFVLVHSPLVGPTTWQPVADVLRRRGHEVVVPSLANPDDPPNGYFRHHAEQVRQTVEAHSRTAPVILVGHSGAGAVLPAAGDRLVNAVSAYVFVDAALPKDRATRLADAPPDFARRVRQLAEGGRVPPWGAWWTEDVLATLLPDEAVRERFAAELQPLPLRLFDEPISVPAAWPDAPCGYLLLSPAYDGPATQAARSGWEVAAMEGGHLHMLVDAEAVADSLEELAGRLLGDAFPHLARPAVTPTPRANDPVVAQRQRLGRLVDAGRRIGFLALAVAIVLFAVALYWDLPGVLVTLIVASLAVATLTLLPAIVVGYGIAAAEREEAEGKPPS